MITKSCWPKETTKGTFLLIYLQGSLGQKAKHQSALLLPCSAGVQGMAHRCSPQHAGLLGKVRCLTRSLLFHSTSYCRIKRILPTFQMHKTCMLCGQSMSKILREQGRQKATGRDLPSSPHLRWGRMAIGRPAHHACLREVSRFLLLKCSLKWKEIGL